MTKRDVLAALFTLANFDELENRVHTPFGAGCSSIVQNPYLEKDVLIFAAPMKKFRTMVANMDESFLITRCWKKVKKRI